MKRHVAVNVKQGASLNFVLDWDKRTASSVCFFRLPTELKAFWGSV